MSAISRLFKESQSPIVIAPGTAVSIGELVRADIPIRTATAAHSGTSWDPDKRGAQMIDEYVATLEHDFGELSKLAGSPEKQEELKREFERYREGYRRRYLVWLGARSQVVSTMIAGPSNFNVRRAEKRNRSEDKRREDLTEFRKRALTAIRRTLTPELQPIKVSDVDASQRIDSKLAGMKKLQEMYKAINVAIRKSAKGGHEAQMKALLAIGQPESRARELLKPDFAGRIGIPSYELTNLNANIKRMEGRAVQVERAQSTPASEIEGANARLEDVPSENRVRLFYPGKPPAATIAELKRSGFRWTPSLGCWQAYRTAIYQAKKLAGVPEETTVMMPPGTSEG